MGLEKSLVAAAGAALIYLPQHNSDFGGTIGPPLVPDRLRSIP